MSNYGEVESDYAIVTTPAPLTAGMTFDPPLDPHQRHAFEVVRYAIAVKVIIVFADQWWNTKLHLAGNATKGGSFSGGLITDEKVRKLWFPPIQPASG